MKNLILMTAIGVILFMSRGIVGPINSLYVESLGANYLTIGVLGAVTALTTIVFSYVWGRMSDRRGKRKLFLVGGLAVLALSSGLIAVAPDYIYLFPLNVLGAAAQAAYAVVSLALMGDILEQSASARGRRMGIYRGLGSLGFGVLAFFSGSVADRFSLACDVRLFRRIFDGGFYAGAAGRRIPGASNGRGSAIHCAAEPQPPATTPTCSLCRHYLSRCSCGRWSRARSTRYGPTTWSANWPSPSRR